ncbi:ABC-type transport system ATP-binding protein [Natrialba magadii ATCC 43099]|uniref:Cobalamin import ATP-binding protein BtuD n=1 Tax=Natrialba magadii (strain ATCC 43099 / DSM 3394 / CCM 3739 / CIP 104546 / IAM 13178 / JCM 8861 / NBRC 102185 / NCIMB 2190 / MS3) TaxID=547559 RepID=D3SW93_NATMM|nr:ABC transporter ATP-binding protein [Natrialba magadii]ADD05754.1 ABC-type transport system ATP-binding protein [Natrialba magadii ATCC 43099]ELY30072.1 ABC transporter [Natrialba magadii ATCC 43099]
MHSSRLVGDDLAIGYPTTEEPVVEVDRIDLPAGEITALVGPNGSGKSTLLKALARQHAPEHGTVLLDGDDIDDFDSKPFARRVGMLSQEYESAGGMTAEELIYYGRYPHMGFFDTPTESDEAAVERAIDPADVGHLREEEVGNLSGGQKQLVWIAMVLAQETDVLLLDEPTTYLDLQHQLQVMELVQTLNDERGVTVGLVLHNISQAARFADYLVAIRDGELYDWGPPREIVSEQLLADVFNVKATVEHDPEIRIHPARALSDQ